MPQNYEVQYVDEEDIRNIVEDTCHFDIQDHGIGYYEYGDGKYNDISMRLSLTSCQIVVQYPIDNESMIFTQLEGTHYLEEYECEYMVTLSHLEYNSSTKMLDVTYDVEES